MNISSTEFYLTPNGEIMINDANGVRQLSQQDRDFISEIIFKMGQFWPSSLEGASKVYEKSRHNVPLFEFKIVRRFLKCNFGKFDSTLDIDQMGNFHFEEVSCPLRGECPHEGIICKPKFNSTLSERELDVMRLFYEGLDAEAVSDKLCLSADTVRTHKRNAFRRTGAHSLSEFFLYARQNNLFNQ